VSKQTEPNCSSSFSRHILIVEDNPDGRETLRTLLELLGYQVDVAEDGLEGVAKALSQHPEIAVVDIGLPRMDGYQVAQQLRAALGRDIFLIAHTGYGQPEDRQRALAAGFDIHLVKPVDFEQLSSCLDKAAASGCVFQRAVSVTGERTVRTDPAQRRNSLSAESRPHHDPAR
jgi:CheY-like chemotaxis protein